MGGFDAYADVGEACERASSVLQGGVGPSAANGAADLRLIRRTLAGTGLLPPDTRPHQIHHAMFAAIRHARRTVSPAQPNADAETINPGDPIERAFLTAVAKGRYPLAHRAVRDSTAPASPTSYVSTGMRRAHERLADDLRDRLPDTQYRRARLPSVSAETFQSNRRLVDALAANGPIPGIEDLIAETAENGGKQGFSDLRDFLIELRRRAPETAETLAHRVARHLSRGARRRFSKLLRGVAPSEADFAPPGRPLS